MKQTMSQEGKNDSENDAMRLAFQQYMLSGRVGSDTTQKNDNIGNREPGESEKKEQERLTKQALKIQQQIKKAEKRYWQIFNGFASMLQEEWLVLDNEAYRVVQAVFELRKRLRTESRLWNQYHQVLQKPEWTKFAYNSSTLNIHCHDVHMALCHDLEQHERMMTGLLGVLSNLSECHESILRQMDVMMKHHYDCLKEHQNLEPGFIVSTTFGKVASLPELLSCLTDMFSRELYRKQCLVHMILDTGNDEMITPGDGFDERYDDPNKISQYNEVPWEDMSPSLVAEHCFKQWPRDSLDYGCIDLKVLNHVFALLK
jgi:hypothetical protein